MPSSGSSVETMLTSYSGRELRVRRVRARADRRTGPRGRRGSDRRRPAGADRHLGRHRQRYRAAQSGPPAARRSAAHRARTRRDGATSPTRSSRTPTIWCGSGYFDQAWRLADAIAAEAQNGIGSGPAAQAVLERFGHGADDEAMSAKHLRGADDEDFERFKRLCHDDRPVVDRARSPRRCRPNRTRARGGVCATCWSASARPAASRCSS